VNPERFDLRDIAPQPWKNGAGLTREIAFDGTDAVAFDWRISVAEFARDAPFSAFPGIARCITLLQGAGMRLRSHDGNVDHALTTPFAPFEFSGDVALNATLAGGACSDFNVMTRRGRFRSEVSVHRDAVALVPADATLLWCGDGAWAVDTHTIATSQALLWRMPHQALHALHARPLTPNAVLLQVRLCHDRRP
jgi:environmental stress-induced protein Ves